MSFQKVDILLISWHSMAKAVLMTGLASVCSDDEAMGVEDVFEEQEEVRPAVLES